MESRAPLALAATVTTIWAAIASMAPTFIVVGCLYIIDNTGEPAIHVLRLGLAGWLLAHGVPVQTGSGEIGLAPLVVTAFAAWRVMRAGVHTARAMRARREHCLTRTIAAGVGVAVVYGLLGAAAAALAQLPNMTVSVPRAAGTLGIFGLITGLTGAAIESRVLMRFGRIVPPILRDAVRTGTTAALLVFGAGAATAGMAIALAGGEAGQILSDYHTGLAGESGLTLVCLLYGPTFALWGTSYLIGPGFLIGTGTVVTAAKVTLGPLPAVPALAGLPSGATGPWGSLLLGLPLAAGMAAGWLLVRRPASMSIERQSPRPSWFALLGAAMIAGPVAGAWFALASLAASGPLGSARLATVGPQVVPVAVAGTILIAAGSAIAALATRLITTRKAHR